MNDLAVQIAAETWDDHTPQLDPVTIAILLQLLEMLLDYLAERCEMDAPAVQRRAKAAGIREKIFVNLLLRRQLSRAQFFELGGDRLVGSFLAVAADDENLERLSEAMGG